MWEGGGIREMKDLIVLRTELAELAITFSLVI